MKPLGEAVGRLEKFASRSALFADCPHSEEVPLWAWKRMAERDMGQMERLAISMGFSSAAQVLTLAEQRTSQRWVHFNVPHASALATFAEGDLT